MTIDLYKKEIVNKDKKHRKIEVGKDISEAQLFNLKNYFGIENIKISKEPIFEPEILLKKWFSNQKLENFSSNFLWDFYNIDSSFFFLLEYNQETKEKLQKDKELFNKIFLFIDNLKNKIFDEIIVTQYGNLICFNPQDIKYNTYTDLYIPFNEIEYNRINFNIKNRKEEEDFFSILKKAFYMDCYCFISYNEKEILEELIKFVPEDKKREFLELQLTKENECLTLEWWE